MKMAVNPLRELATLLALQRTYFLRDPKPLLDTAPPDFQGDNAVPPKPTLKQKFFPINAQHSRSLAEGYCTTIMKGQCNAFSTPIRPGLR